MNEPAFSWTSERTDLLKELWIDKKLTAEIIAERLGAPSRNAVLGKVNRLGLSRPRPPKPPKGPPVARRGGFRPHPTTAPLVPDAAPPAAAGPPCSLLDLTNATCRWPLGDGPPFMFCGDPTADLANGQPYCPAHTRMARSSGRDYSDDQRAALAGRGRRRLGIKDIGVEKVNPITLEGA